MPLRTYLFLCIFLVLTACMQQIKIPEQAYSEKNSLPLAASQAWQNKDYVRSGSLYQRLLASKKIHGSQALLAWKRMTYSGLNSQNYKIAQAGVKGWKAADPGTQMDEQWLQANFLVNSTLLPQEVQEKNIRQFLLRHDLPWKVQTRVLDFVHNRLWQRKDYARALAFSRILYSFSPEYEQNLLQSKIIFALERMDRQELQTLVPQQVKKFPDNCIAAVLAQRQAEKNPAQGRQEYERLLALSRSESWKDDFPLQQKLGKLKADIGYSKQSVALLLPLSGDYAKLSGKILQGTEIGLELLFKNGFDTNVRVINSEAADWLTQIQNLPPSVTFIGGPLRKNTWQQIIKKGLHRHYVFFTFLSHLEDEGQKGWRFFSSAQDQIRSLIKACNQQKNIQDFAILYPEEPYGKEMAKIFWDELQKNNLHLKGMQAYIPENHESWGKSVATLLGVKKEQPKDWQPEFDAVFLPDSFSAARQLVPSFFYNDAGNLLFLGPQLWSSSQTATGPEKKYFSNSFFPGAWWEQNPAPTARFLDEKLGLREEGAFWEALGFDFIRFLSRIKPLSSNWTPGEVNSRLEIRAREMDWTLAPVFWNKQGQAQQKMYIFRACNPQVPPLFENNTENSSNFLQ